MINFIILEDDLLYINKYKKIIDKVMMNYDINYTLTIYDKYTSNINDLLKEEIFKIYILDYNKTTKEMIKYIREYLDDWQSLIILLFTNIEEKDKVIDKNYFIVDYLNKNSNFKTKLTRNIEVCLKNYDKRPNSLKYTYKRVVYNIKYKSILYIEKEQDNKRCIIKTKDNEYYIPGTLNNIEKLLDKRFYKCSRSYIVNLEQVTKYDMKNNVLVLKNIKLPGAVSREKKKEIMNYLRKL